MCIFMYKMDSYIPILVIIKWSYCITPTNGLLNGELSFFSPAILSADINNPPSQNIPDVFLGDSRNLHGLELGGLSIHPFRSDRLVRSLSSTLQSPTGSLGSEAWQFST